MRQIHTIEKNTKSKQCFSEIQKLDRLILLKLQKIFSQELIFSVLFFY